MALILQRLPANDAAFRIGVIVEEADQSAVIAIDRSKELFICLRPGDLLQDGLLESVLLLLEFAQLLGVPEVDLLSPFPGPGVYGQLQAIGAGDIHLHILDIGRPADLKPGIGGHRCHYQHDQQHVDIQGKIFALAHALDDVAFFCFHHGLLSSISAFPSGEGGTAQAVTDEVLYGIDFLSIGGPLGPPSGGVFPPTLRGWYLFCGEVLSRVIAGPFPICLQ